MSNGERSALRSIVPVMGAVRRQTRPDLLAIEEPLEIRIGRQPISVTMRTPGNDFELAAGFLRGEGIIHSRADIAAISTPGPERSNVVRVDFAPSLNFDLAKLGRHFYATSSCGVCGKSSLDAIENRGFESIPIGTVQFPALLLQQLPELLRHAQPTFDETGGLHAAALFSATGELIAVREDVGRHNAVDKVLGFLLLNNREVPDGAALLVSGRASFELVQKTIASRIPILAAVGAPSTLACELAEEFDLTLAGFIRNGRFNIYSREERISCRPATTEARGSS